MTRRSLDDARQITSVLHSRISDRVSLDPVGDTFADWTPTVEDPQWQTYLNTLARAADDRRRDNEPPPKSPPARPGRCPSRHPSLPGMARRSRH